MEKNQKSISVGPTFIPDYRVHRNLQINKIYVNLFLVLFEMLFVQKWSCLEPWKPEMS